ncbi:4Fe-4S binding protein [Phaeacidiphilus oryzae]|uniref:4Fe-4S binding protein n=1 Tax=Phaeacidiphilus oryzae TaxID=348818 RepID=UPI000AFF9882|nr:4Fe-4S binding protein [Phaeacidiphilus oryzae]
MTAPVEVTAACAGCGACLLTCPTHAIRPTGGGNTGGGNTDGGTTGGRTTGSGPLRVLDSLCTACLECIEVCPVDAITTTEEAS